MISYPGEIIHRFGRYEAVEDLGPEEQGHCWRAWDPFLERFVCIAALPELDPVELHRTLPRLEYALKTWLGRCDSDAVLDFSPGGPAEPPFFVLRPAESQRESSINGSPPPAAPDPNEGERSAWRKWAIRMMGPLSIRLGFTSPQSKE